VNLYLLSVKYIMISPVGETLNSPVIGLSISKFKCPAASVVLVVSKGNKIFVDVSIRKIVEVESVITPEGVDVLTLFAKL